MAHNMTLEDGEIQLSEQYSGSESETVMASPTRGTKKLPTADTKSSEENVSRTSRAKKDKKSKRYDELNSRMSKMEAVLNNMQNFLDKQENTRGTRRKSRVADFESSDDNTDDNVSLFACGQISPSHKDEEHISPDLDPENGTNDCNEASSSLFDIFGEDAIVKKTVKKSGIILDKSQIEVLESSYRCAEPNFLTAFSEENFDLFPVDEDAEKLLQVPSLDSLVEMCLTKRYGPKASFAKGKFLYTQPAKMIEKIAYKGQQAARLGLVIQMYLQQSLGNLLQLLDNEDLDKEKASKMIKDIFAMSTKSLDQLGRAGAFHHITRRAVCMTDTGLYEQSDKLEFTNLPLTGDGVFGQGLESLLKAKKEKRKQVDDLIPDVRKKRKPNEPPKRQVTDKSATKSDNTNTSSNSGWGNFRIPKVTRSDNKTSTRGRGGFGQRRPAAGRGEGSAKPDPK